MCPQLSLAFDVSPLCQTLIHTTTLLDFIDPLTQTFMEKRK